MKKGDIISYVNEHKSHSWNNGLFVIMKVRKDGIVTMRKINENGSLQSFDTCTNYIDNPYMKVTRLKYV